MVCDKDQNRVSFCEDWEFYKAPFGSDYEVCRITENLGYDCGIFIKDLESGEVVETGYAFLEFGSIDSLLDELPEITE